MTAFDASKDQPKDPQADPSMEDILASIRRILSEDDPAARAAEHGNADTRGAASLPPAMQPGGQGHNSDDVLMLEPSMMVPDPNQHASQAPEAWPQHAEPHSPPQTQVPMNSYENQPNQYASQDYPPQNDAPSSLVAPEAAAAAASSVGSLVRSIAAERSAQVYSGGPTLEDMVRAELRPLLKQWLDENLPPMVERLVRAELERVIGRANP